MPPTIPLPFDSDVKNILVKQGYGGVGWPANDWARRTHIDYGPGNIYNEYYAIDFGRDIGGNLKDTPVRAQGKGTVEYVNDGNPDNTGAYFGNFLTIKYDPNSQYEQPFYATYAHLQPGIRVSAGNKVSAGDILGLVGSTGLAHDAPHLHAEYSKQLAISSSLSGVSSGPGRSVTLPIKTADASQAVNTTPPVFFRAAAATNGVPSPDTGIAYNGNHFLNKASNGVLAGGPDDDVLSGGPGADVFVLSGGNDIITDFNPAEGDRIQIPEGTTPGLGPGMFFISTGDVGDDLLLRYQLAGKDATVAIDGPFKSSLVSFDPKWFINAPNNDGPPIGTNKPPVITRVETFKEDTFHQGALVYFRLNFTDPDNDAIGFGFHGIKGAGWAPEEHLFTSPSYGRVAPGQVEYPFNLASGTASAYQSDVAAYIFDAAGNHSPEVQIHLVS